jgi:hypothetical protein
MNYEYRFFSWRIKDLNGIYAIFCKIIQKRNYSAIDDSGMSP